jgi:hypothetical protein
MSKSAAFLIGFLGFLLACSLGFTQTSGASSPSPGEAAQKPKTEEIWALVDGQPITRAEAEKSIADELAGLYQRIYELQTKSLDRLIERKILEREAKKRGISVEQLIDIEIKSKIPAVTDEEVGRTYSRYKTQRTTTNVNKESLYRSIYIQKYYAALQDYVDSLRKDISVEVFLEEPKQVEHGFPKDERE